MIVYRERALNWLEWGLDLIPGVNFDLREEIGRIPYDAFGDPTDKELAIGLAKKITSKDALDAYLKAAAQGIVEAPEKAVKIAFPALGRLAAAIDAGLVAKESGGRILTGEGTPEDGLKVTLVTLTTVLTEMVLQKRLAAARATGAATITGPSICIS